MTINEFNVHYGRNTQDSLTKDGKAYTGVCNGLSYWYKIFDVSMANDLVTEIESFTSDWDEESGVHDTPRSHLAIAAGYSLV